MQKFPLFVTYSQIAVFDGRLSEPFNDWTVAHVRQGFSWRQNSVSFRTLESGEVEFEVVVLPSVKTSDMCTRAISVPFSVTPGAKLEVATITDSRQISLNPGSYQVVFETGWIDSHSWVRMVFVPNGLQHPAILIRDDDLHPSEPLLMHGEPA